MGGVNVDGGGGGGKKSVDSEVPLVPFIDLLLCCIMFLLVTAVWNRMARIEANQKQTGPAPLDEEPPEEPPVMLYLHVTADGYKMTSDDGTNIDMPKQNGEYDRDKLLEELKKRREQEPNRTDLIVSPQDGVEYQYIVSTMDAVVGQGYKDMSLGQAPEPPAPQ